MKKSYKLITASIFAASAVFAQQQQIIPCFSDEATKYYFDKHPEEKIRYDKEMQEAKFTPGYLDKLAAQRGNGQNQVSNSTFPNVDTIPVVFHILHQGGIENVPNSYIYQALAEVNRVHTKTIPDVAQIDPLFQGVSGANNYVFQLASKDPSGNCTNGIVRHYDSNTYWDQTNPNYAYTWDRTKYLNIYIVKFICTGQPCPPTSTSGGIVVGYTYLPGTVSAAMDVVVYNYQFMTGTNARSMAHEFGHWLGLSHTFGPTNSAGGTTCTSSNDDKLATSAPAVACVGVTDDTPKYQGAFSTCPASSPNACDPSNSANVQNIMDYSSCPKNFTNGQITRMHNIMNSTTASRNNVISAANKIATGVRYPHPCVPVPNFHASARVVCTGATVTFSDSTTNTITTGFNWNFPGGTFVSGSSATDSMPKVTYATPGTYAVSYTASTTTGGAPITKNSYITAVSSVAAYNTSFTEGFETATVPGTDWSVSHTPSTGVDWAATSSASAAGSKSIMIDNFANPAGDTSTLLSPSFNLAAIGSPTLKFKMAYQQKATTNLDKFQIYTSIDCGGTWVSRFARSGTGLQPTTVTGQSTTPFIPSSGQFATYTVNIGSIASSTNAMFRFVFYSSATSQGNNIYLDDINVYNTTVGIKNIETEVGLEIYPNPSSGNVNIAFGLDERHNISVSVIDMLGRVVETIPSQNYPSGQTNITIGSKAHYQSGVYFINIDIDGQHISKKIIVQ
ncbi:MAG TPA: M43 family zinc metalloprotease [Bacteroidia bacterium]|jgi:PKD repeat protein|nr:M43 family zinc metalloprotease [Bacteroidia bacterium]